MSATAKRRRNLSVACAVDPDVYRQVATLKPLVDRAKCDADVLRALQSLYRRVHVVSAGNDLEQVLADLRAAAPDVVFNLAQSTTDREPSFAGVLDFLELAYTGASPLGIALSRDKVRSRRLLEANGIRVPRFVELRSGVVSAELALTPPLIVKPAQFGGCSYGIYRNSVVLTRQAALRRARELWTKLGVHAVCDEFIVGREFRLGIVEDPKSQRFQLVGITEGLFPRARSGWGFKTEAIRLNSRVRRAQGVESIVPKLSKQRIAEFRYIAETSARLLDVQGYATLDVRLDLQGQAVVLEVNANPGLSGRSRIWSRPTFETNIARIVGAALTRKQR